MRELKEWLEKESEYQKQTVVFGSNKIYLEGMSDQIKNTLKKISELEAKIIGEANAQANVSGSNLLHLPEIKKKVIAELVCPDCQSTRLENHLDYIHCKKCDTYYEKAN